jgi:hypothetical protein
MLGVRYALGISLLLVLTSCSQKPTTEVKNESKGEDSAEVKWALKIADEFLETVKTREGDQQKSLTTEAFQKSQDHGIYALNSALGLKKWTVTAKDRAPDGMEVSIKGTAVVGYREDGWNDRNGDWTINVVKDKDTDRWRVNYCRIVVNLDK